MPPKSKLSFNLFDNVEESADTFAYRPPSASMGSAEEESSSTGGGGGGGGGNLNAQSAEDNAPKKPTFVFVAQIIGLYRFNTQTQGYEALNDSPVFCTVMYSNNSFELLCYKPSREGLCKFALDDKVRKEPPLSS